MHGRWCSNFGCVQDERGEAYCVALYDYQGDTADDLSFVAGERIILTAHEGSDWLRGIANGKQGMFPASFVNIVKDLDGEFSFWLMIFQLGVRFVLCI